MLIPCRTHSTKTFSSSVKNSAYKIICNRLYSSTSDDKNKYDIIVAGGGMVGTTLACTLGMFLHPQALNTPLLLFYNILRLCLHNSKRLIFRQQQKAIR